MYSCSREKESQVKRITMPASAEIIHLQQIIYIYSREGERSFSLKTPQILNL